MAGAVFWLLSILIFDTTRGSPLPEGQNLIISTGTPDTINILDQMMGDSATRIDRVRTPKIDDLQVHSEIKFRFAQTVVTSKVRNPAGFSQQLSFSVVLPQEAFITGFVMKTYDKSYRAFLVEKSEADAAYSNAVQSNTAGAMVSFRDSNLFDISINVEAYQQVTFRLAYDQLLQREYGLYRHVVTISPGQVVAGMKAKVHIIEPRNITKILVPMFAINNLGNRACAGANMNTTCLSDNEMVKKTSLSGQEVLLEFGPSKKEQKLLAQGTGRGLAGQFEVLYDVERDESGGEILVKDGYFIHTFAPPAGTAYLPKHIIFVLDVSGSMEGQKIHQLKDAMQSILPDLRSDDLFNIIVFANYRRNWGFNGVSDAHEDNIQVAFAANPQNIEDAKSRIYHLIAFGGTDIFGALSQAVRTAKNEQSLHPDATKPIIFFLTDGEPTHGITKHDEIINKLAKINNSPQIPIYCFAFGEGTNYEFLKRLSLSNSGIARRIYEGLDANVQLRDVYKDISNAVLSNVTFKYLPEEVDLSSVTKLDYHTFFEGTELIVTGRTIDKNAKTIKAEMIATGSNRSSKKYQAQTVVPPTPIYKTNDSLISLADPNATHKPGSMERTWAYLTIKQLIDKSKTAAPGSPDERRAIEMAKKYNFASEVTSFVVVKPDGGKQVADVKRIIANSPDSTTPTAKVFPMEPPTDKTHISDNLSNLPTLQQVSYKRLPEYKLYDKVGGLQSVSWLSAEARTKGYVELMNINGTFTTYAILEDIDQLDPEDEPNCTVDNLAGKCRHLSLCVIREIAKDFYKFRKYYQCEFEDYLAICCPH